jgi:hypothetical protein
MTTTDVINPDLKTILRRLKLSRMLDTLPERLTLARQQKMPHQDLLLQVLSDEVARRDSLAVTLILDDFAIDILDPVESRDLYDLLLERYRTGSVIVTSNRGLMNGSPRLRIPSGPKAPSIASPVTPTIWPSTANRIAPGLKPRLDKDATERSR